jgi:glycosyltransferase involved in cell wall biosynthesis
MGGVAVSLLVVARLGDGPLRGLLEHLADLQDAVEFEVVIAAAAPDDAVRALLDTLSGDVTIVPVDGSLDDGAALAVAVGVARGDRTLVLTPQMRPSAADLAAPTTGLDRAAIGPRASVIVCTRDRPDEVRGCIEGLLASGLGAAGCEVVVVDNGATAAADATIAALVALAPGTVIAIREPIAGLARARMAGAAVAAHDVLVYLDDDARADHGWLEALRDAFDDPSVAIAGGPIRALWDVPPERERVPQAWGFLLGVLDLGDADRNISPSEGPFGGNWAIRRAALDAVGGFDLGFGPSDASRLGGEESHVGQEVVRRHLGLIRYVAAASVGHRISSRVTDAQLILRAFRVGAGEIAVGVRAGTIDAEHARLRLHAALDGLATLLGEVPETIESCLAAVAASDAAPGARLLAAARIGHVAGCAAATAVWNIPVGRSLLVVEPANARGIVQEGRLALEAVSSW